MPRIKCLASEWGGGGAEMMVFAEEEEITRDDTPG